MARLYRWALYWQSAVQVVCFAHSGFQESDAGGGKPNWRAKFLAIPELLVTTYQGDTALVPTIKLDSPNRVLVKACTPPLVVGRQSIPPEDS
jgi:hypothetical protein